MTAMPRLMQPGPRTLNRLPADVDAKPYERFDVHPVTPHIGAEITGVELASTIDDELATELRRALREWKVIFFRDQHTLTPERQLEFAKLWGEPETNPFFPTGDSVTVSRLAKDAQAIGTENLWHSDHSFLAAPAKCSVLRAIEIPPAGGDTIWTDMSAVYDNLRGDIKERIEGRIAIHDWIQSWGALMTPERKAELRKTMPQVQHPVIARHPETGRKLLYVNEPFTTEIIGIPTEENAALVEYLVLQARIPEYQVRFRWEPNSVAVWDNIATQHYAVNDYYPQRRVMERVAIAGVPLH
ncbi:TauD/TfdA family dioxygenase [Nocardia sp. CNY236]|uniref:TauD/TfdA dioxygenase family protein n=1 Tax=Nocardia sp. CNY236 TaxID=1169152 RepID=UPI0004218D34|nr:TauD/TfdA family dioxygenase [Nocardia sp. CNY236]